MDDSTDLPISRRDRGRRHLADVALPDAVADGVGLVEEGAGAVHAAPLLQQLLHRSHITWNGPGSFSTMELLHWLAINKSSEEFFFTTATTNQ